MSIPTAAEEYAKLREYIIKAQEASAMLMHLHRAQGTCKDNALADGWFSVSECLKLMTTQINMLAQGKLQ